MRRRKKRKRGKYESIYVLQEVVWRYSIAGRVLALHVVLPKPIPSIPYDCLHLPGVTPEQRAKSKP